MFIYIEIGLLYFPRDLERDSAKEGGAAAQGVRRQEAQVRHEGGPGLGHRRGPLSESMVCVVRNNL